MAFDIKKIVEDIVSKIQNDGRARRAEAENELEKIEGALKQKLLEMKG